MVVFGLVSSLFDFVTFGVLLILLHATMDSSGLVHWVNGLCIDGCAGHPYEEAIFHRPSRYLMTVTLLVGAATFILPFTPLSEPFLTNVPASILADWK